VSSKVQLAYGYSLEAQVDKCLKYAERHELTLGPESNSGREGVFVDGAESATFKSHIMDRPGGRRMLASIQPGDHVIATVPHRLWRNLYESEKQIREWEGIGVHLHFVDLNIRSDTPNGRLLLQVLCAIAEWNSRIRSLRSKEGIAWGKLRRKQYKTDKTRLHVRPEDKGLRNQSDKLEGDTPAMTRLFLAKSTADRDKSVTFTGIIRAYIRVSKEYQNASNQREEILKQLKANPEYEGCHIEWYCDTGYSAYTTDFKDRPEGKRLLKELYKGDMVLVLRADRMVRSVQNLYETSSLIRAKGAYIQIMDCGIRSDMHDGQIMLAVLALVAEMESHELGVSSTAGVRMSYIKNGVPLNQLPKFLHPVPDYEAKPSLNPLCLLSVEEKLDLYLQYYEKLKTARAKGESWLSASNEMNRITCDLTDTPHIWTRSFHHGRKGYVQVFQMLEALYEHESDKPYTERLTRYLEKKEPNKLYPGWFNGRAAGVYFKQMDKWMRFLKTNPESLRAAGGVQAEDRILSRIETYISRLT
jgi:DNA invertase Pin-like site-specific DNA recombinase